MAIGGGHVARGLVVFTLTSQLEDRSEIKKTGINVKLVFIPLDATKSHTGPLNRIQVAALTQKTNSQHQLICILAFHQHSNDSLSQKNGLFEQLLW